MGHQINHIGIYDLCGAETVAAKRCGGETVCSEMVSANGPTPNYTIWYRHDSIITIEHLLATN